MFDTEEIRNAFNFWLNPTHTLFAPYQWWKRIAYYRFFNQVEKNPLTKNQRIAIILDQQRNLVVAGAGTGKTSTVVGKIGYLLKSKKAKPEEILVLAYNRAAASELHERIQKLVKQTVSVGTFHSVGKNIISEASYPKRVSPFVEQNDAYRAFLQKNLEKCLEDETCRTLYATYFLQYEYSKKDEHQDFKTFAEYSSWIRRNYLRTLNKDRVKSYGELQIANYLFANGITYTYEPTYAPKRGPTLGSIYKPDFHIPSVDAYVEYFGIDEDGNTAPYINQEKYLRDMKWKIERHQAGGTNLIRLFYYQNRDGQLLNALENELVERGAKFKPIDNEEVFRKINETEKNVGFIDLVERFLGQLKENTNNVSIEALKELHSGDERIVTFLTIFEKIYHTYQHELETKKYIDFGDMISTSANLVRRGAFVSPWKYIIIDEFQDISAGRFDLIKALCEQNKKTKLFCVGDDWQAIYRFAGSDHQIMSKFRQIVGSCSQVKLDVTFRFNNKIAQVSEKFVTRNPSQIRKYLRTLSFKKAPQVYLHWTDQRVQEALHSVVDQLVLSEETEGKTLQLLVRYNRSKSDLTDRFLKDLAAKWNGEILRPRTIHAAKGLEADFVILVDLNSQKNGFPSERENDPILNLVLSRPDSFEHSEERRLFYVALTRAREQTHLIASSAEQSVFASELASGSYSIAITGTAETETPCPICEDGKIVEKRFSDGSFFGCGNYPLCDFRAAKCFTCNEAMIKRATDSNGNVTAQCSLESCAEEYEACGQCSEGVLVKKASPYGDFLGCHTYQRTKCNGKKDLPIIT